MFKVLIHKAIWNGSSEDESTNETIAARIKSQSLIAVIRDDLRRFEDEIYSDLIKKIDGVEPAQTRACS